MRRAEEQVLYFSLTSSSGAKKRAKEAFFRKWEKYKAILNAGNFDINLEGLDICGDKDEGLSSEGLKSVVNFDKPITAVEERHHLDSTVETNDHLCSAVAYFHPNVPPDMALQIDAILSAPSVQQNKLSSMLDTHMFNLMLENSSTADRARLLSVSSAHASSWLSVVPSQGLGLHLDPPAHQIAIKWWLGLDTSQGSQCALCPGIALDPLGHHAITSGVSAGSAAQATETRKHMANDAKCNELGWLCVPLVAETYGAWGKEAMEAFSQLASRLATHTCRLKSAVTFELYSRLNLHLCECGERSLTRDLAHTRPADILIAGWDRGKPAALDLTITSPLCSQAGAAALAAETRKLHSNGPKCQELSWSCIPLAVETYGNWDKQAHDTFSRLASFLAIHQSSPKAVVVAEIYGRLNVVLVRSIARAILARELPPS
ncbi:hypothetical protein EMCRGX_G032712 [Ephydatia muelleri]